MKCEKNQKNKNISLDSKYDADQFFWATYSAIFANYQVCSVYRS